MILYFLLSKSSYKKLDFRLGERRMVVKNEKELGEALKEGVDTIVVEGDLKNKVVRIKATGKVAWAIAIGAIAVAVTAILTTPATVGTSEAVAFAVAPAAIGILGPSTTIAAIGIAVTAGGIGALNSLRKYKIVEHSNNRIVLKRE